LVALPLMVSTGMFSLVLFVDRTLLLWHQPSQMGAALAAGNLFWAVTCPFVGVASMTGAIISQHVGAGQRRRISRLLWQSVWFTGMTVPVFAALAFGAPALFSWTGQPPELLPLQTTYFFWLMWGAAGEVLQTALSGFFSGTHRTRVIMVVSILSGILNILLDVVLIFGIDPTWWGGSGEPILQLGIAGAAIASTASFWFKAIAYTVLLVGPVWRRRGGLTLGWRPHRRTLWQLIYYGTPAGIMLLTESLGFTAIVLQIGQLGDVPLQATTMAINFNMVAFVPLVGLSIAASVLVGQHLIAHGAERAALSVTATLLVAWIYSACWGVAYVLAADWLIGFYTIWPGAEESIAALQIAEALLGFVAIYVLLDATQLILAGALRGAGDTWFVLAIGLAISVASVAVGAWYQPAVATPSPADATIRLQTAAGRPAVGMPDASVLSALNWWWWVITAWVTLLAIAMSARFLSGRWRRMRMI